MGDANERVRLTVVSVTHYVRLVYRMLLFLAALAAYILARIRSGSVLNLLEDRPVILSVIWAVFVIEMVQRFFPSRLESPGCQKQFKRNYIKSGEVHVRIEDNNATMLVALVWICFNAVFGVLYMQGVLDDGILILLCCAYSVCDMVCILFFCPFQSWFLRNKCCSTCRIYNWDYAMMFTPLFFIRGLYSWSLLALSLALMARWEITFYKHPERFSSVTNEYLRCEHCTEKLCTHKKQLHSLWKKIAEFTRERTARLRK